MTPKSTYCKTRRRQEMSWVLSTDFTVEDSQTGYIIHLLAGSWVEPLSIKPQAPMDMPSYEQARYLRLGLEFAKTFMLNRLKYTSVTEY